MARGLKLDLNCAARTVPNVKFWLSEHGYDPDDEAVCQRIFEAAKRTSRVLRDEEIREIIESGAVEELRSST